GYTNSSGQVINGGTVQILLAGGDVLTNKGTNPLTTTDLSGNTNGILIKGITDNGSANNDVAMSLATGDFDGDDIDDLVIGDANAGNGQGAIYVIYGKYLTNTNNRNSTIDVTNLTSAQGYAFTLPIPDNPDTFFAQAGFSLVVGNFDGDLNYTRNDIAFGAFGWGGLYVAYNGGSPGQIDYFPLNLSGAPSAGIGFSLGVSHYSPNGPLTFTGNNKSDDLFVGAPGHRQEITNQWSGRAGLPSGNQGDYPDSSEVAIGAVYVFSSDSSGLSATPVGTYTGPTIPDTNGLAANYFAGTAIASGDFSQKLDVDGDGQQDLAISAPGVNGNSGTVYVVSGKGSVQSDSPQALHQVSNLTINGGIPSGKVGTIISAPGDINGDSYQDFLITAPQAVNGTGQSYLLFGSSDFFTNPTIDLSNTANNGKKTFLLNGSLPYQLAGTAAIGIGDINGDQVDDLMVTAPNAQQAYAIYGHPWLAADGSIKLSDIASDNGFVIDGNTFETFNVLNTSTANAGTVVSPALVSYQNTLYMAYKGQLDQNIYFTSSQDGGKNWTNPTTIFTGATDFAPSLTVADDGTLYLAYVGLDPLVNVAYSTNGGNTWNGQYPINGQVASNTATLVFYQDNLVLVYPAGENNSLNVPAGTFLYSYYSDFSNLQNLANWPSPTSITYNGSFASAASAISAAVLTDSNGTGNTLYLACQGGTPDAPLTNLYLVSTAGANLSDLTWNVSEIPNVISEQAPALTTNGNTLYLTNTNASNTDGEQLLSLSTSTNGMAWTTWGLPGTSNYAPVATLQDNQLYLAQSLLNSDTNSDGIQISSSPLPVVGTISLNGSLVRLLGDVNGDGFADVFSGGKTGVIVFGKSTNALLDAAITTDDLIISVPNANLRDVISLGDFNGDGFKDFGILDSNSNFSVVLGSPVLGQLGQLTVTPTSTSVAISEVGGVTKSMAIGDYNGDGYDDVLLWGDNGNQVAWGNATGSLNSFTNVDYPETQTSATGIDLNGDGYKEIAIGSDRREIAGTVSTTGSFALLPTVTTSSVIDTLAGANQLVNIGDFNGDGIADLAVLASNYYAATLGDPTRLDQAGNQGGVFIYYGSLQGLTNSSQPDVILAAPFSTVSGQQSPFFLSEIAQAGDVNGDGFDDLLISSPFTVTANGNQGSVFVVFGGNSWSNQPFDLGQLSANQSEGSSAYGFLVDGIPDAQAGFAISGGSDVNGDGFDDVAIGAPGGYGSDLSQNTVIGDDKGRVWYNGQQINSGKRDPAVISMVVQDNASGSPQIVAGLDNGEVWWYNGSSWSQLNSSDVVNDWAAPINTLSVQWNEQGQPPQVIVGLGGAGGVFLFTGDSDNWSTLIDSGEDSPITQMAVQWQENPPRVVVGYQDGSIAYSVDITPDTNPFPQPESSNSSTPITQMAVNWQENGDPQIVIGLGDKGGVEYYDGSGWNILENLSPAWSSSVTQMSVQWNTAGNPQ
ncbi:FG-GAP repeat protein, partial [Synechocystis salina LEGE 06155]|nr:FG-GAP repeat protein [Synechocystis salina LEGE 06155]